MQTAGFDTQAFPGEPRNPSHYAELLGELGYRDVTPVVEALGITARYLRDNPIARGSITEQRLQDPFDYEAEDALIETYRSATTGALELADAYDPEFRDRYAPGSNDWRLVEAKN